MINLFRKIRQNLLSEGKTGIYIKYAIGDIVHVVIGILIALQINNLKKQWPGCTTFAIVFFGLPVEFPKLTPMAHFWLHDPHADHL